MDIEYLYEFVVLSEIGNYQQAADALFLSQTTLSRHMQSLEKELGVELFDRTSRTNSLTEYGTSFLNHAHSLIQGFQSAKRDLSTHVQKNKGFVSIVVPHHFRFYGISDLITSFTRFHPDIRVSINERTSYSVPMLIETGGAAIGFMTEIGSAQIKGFFKHELCKDTMAVCLPAGHPLCKYEAIDPKMLKSEEFAMPMNRGPIYSSCLNACANVGFQPLVVHHLSAENIYELVANNLCVAFMPKKPALASLPVGVQIRDLTVATTIHVNLIYPDRQMSEAEEAFRDYALKYIQRMNASK